MLNSDIPIKNINEDLLNRADFAQQLANAIIKYNQESSFNIGLYGEWGSGKTSVINMIEEKLQDLATSMRDKPIIMRFNPWLFSDQTQLITQFFAQLSSEFNLNNSSKATKRIANALETFGGALEFTSLIPQVGAIGKISSTLTKDIGKGIRNYAEIKESIQHRKNVLVQILSESSSKIIVIIDDIDRLSNEEICAVFQLVKSIADFPNTIYLLAFDFEIVSRALTGVQNYDGSKYLEKIIQVPFHLPHINEQQLTQIFLNKLNDTIVEIPDEFFDKEKWSMLFHAGIKPLLTTVRDTIRLNNTISLKYAFLASEVDISDLIGITAIQVFAPHIYSSLPLYKENFCGSPQYPSGNQKEQELKTLYDNITQDLDEHIKKPVTEVLCYLFPKVSSIIKKGISGARYHNSSSQRLGNIYNANYFDRYFSLSLDNSLSIKEAQNIILFMNEEQIKETLLRLDAKKQINLFLDYLNAFFAPLKKTDKYKERIVSLLLQIIPIWKELHDADAANFFSHPWILRMMNTVDCLLWVINDEHERYLLLENIFKNPNVSTSIKIRVLMGYEKSHKRFLESDEKEKEYDEHIFKLDNVLRYESICTELIRTQLGNMASIDKEDLSAIQWFVEKCDNDELKAIFREHLIQIQSTNLGLSKFIATFVGHGKGASNFVFDIWNIYLDKMKNHIDIENAIMRMEQFIITDEFTNLDLQTREDIIAFLSFCEVKDEMYRENATRPLMEKYAEKHNVSLNPSK